MKIAVTGSTGLVGSRLVSQLTEEGHLPVPVVRHPPQAGEVQWHPAENRIDAAALEGCDAVVHLAGENIAKRWSKKQKQKIRDSRVKGTQLLAEALAEMEHKPQVLVSASAIGFYGDRGDAVLDEDSTAGEGFLAEVCREWEAATAPARQAGIRVVNLRTGIVLSKAGGALAQMLTPFRFGLGGRVGSGKQYWSWIALDDLTGIIRFALEHEGVSGPVNAVSPNPVTNQQFTKVLGEVLHRPTLLPVPEFAARLALGEMADELLLASARAVPKRLQAAGYTFQYPELHDALGHALGKKRPHLVS